MNVLFVCTGNTCRSPMAEVIFNHLIKKNKIKNFSCSSAGVSAKKGDKASLNAIKVCKEWDLDLKSHRSKNIFDLPIQNYDLFVVMNYTHLEILKSLGISQDKIIVLGSSIGDPFGENLDVYRKCRDQINKALKNLLEELNLDEN